jgi:antitoxin MazE
MVVDETTYTMTLDRGFHGVYSLYIREELSMQTKIQKWGNSLGLRIPRSFAAEAQVKEGATVDLSVENGQLLVRPLRVRKYSLAALLRKVDRRNLHGEVSTGRAVGREAW